MAQVFLKDIAMEFIQIWLLSTIILVRILILLWDVQDGYGPFSEDLIEAKFIKISSC